MDCGFATPQAFANITFCISRRVARIWKRGGLFWKSEKCANDLDSNFHWSWISFRRFVQKLRARKFKAFFRPTLGDLQKKKGLRQNSEWFFGRIPKFKAFFRPKLGDLQKKKGLRQNSEWFFGRILKFKGFFRPKLGDLQKQKKKTKKKVFAKIESDFSAEIRRFFPPKIRWSPKKKKGLRQNWDWFFVYLRKFIRLRGAVFVWGGAIFHFSQTIGLKNTKNMRFCILQKPMGGARAPSPPPGYASVYILPV